MSNLRPLDLNGVVLSYVSIDEFKPKTGDPEDLIVLALYCSREAAAEDLKSFIASAMFDVIDVEKSDVPDNKNRFLVFVEMKRDKRFIPSVINILNDVNNITGDMRWVFSTYMDNKVRKLTPKNLKQFVITDSEKYREVIEKEEKKIKRKQKIKEINKVISRVVEKSHVVDSEFNVVDGKKIVTFYFNDPDYEGSFSYKLKAIKTKDQIKNEYEGVKGREGTLPNSVLNPLSILFGDKYKIHNQENLIFIVPDFELDYVLILGVL